jgi:hypothetical protein
MKHKISLTPLLKFYREKKRHDYYLATWFNNVANNLAGHLPMVIQYPFGTGIGAINYKKVLTINKKQTDT